VAERIFLIGYRGTGKSTVARLLAERLAWTWCDADQTLEERFGTTIRQIFAGEGEAGFRNKEAMILGDLATRSRCVIATGGGVVLRRENRERLKSGVTIWLTADPQTIWQRMQSDSSTAARRPDLAEGGLREIEGLLRVRSALYEASADWRTDTTKQTPQQVADKIFDWLQGRRGADILGT